MGILIDFGTLLANGDGRSTVSTIGCHKLDAAVRVPVVVPAHEFWDPLTCSLFGGKGLAAVIRPAFSAPRNFVYSDLNSDSECTGCCWRAVAEHAQFIESALQRCCTHCLSFRRDEAGVAHAVIAAL